MKYSRKQISKAGEKLLTSKSNVEIEESLNLINDWRTNHLHPLVVLKNNLLRLLGKNNIEPNLVSQRLKRLTSIQYKLDLNPSMGLGGMQDIGGYRAVLKDVKDLNESVLEIIENLVKATNKNSFYSLQKAQRNIEILIEKWEVEDDTKI